jgi:hypothetical protein
LFELGNARSLRKGALSVKQRKLVRADRDGCLRRLRQIQFDSLPALIDDGCEALLEQRTTQDKEIKPWKE